MSKKETVTLRCECGTIWELKSPVTLVGMYKFAPITTNVVKLSVGKTVRAEAKS